MKNYFKIFNFILFAFIGIVLTSCKSYTFNEADLEGVWTFKRDIIIVGGSDICKYEKGVVLLKMVDDVLYFSEIYNPLYESEINQDELNLYKDNYKENFKKILNFTNNKITSAYDLEQSIITGVAINKTKLNKGLIEVRFLNDRSDEDVMISEVYINLKKTALTF